MVPENLLKLLVAVVVITMAIVLFMHGSKVPLKSYYEAFSTAALVAGLFLLLWERYLWHWWPFYPYIHRKPDLRGTWRGHLDSSYVDPETKQQRRGIEVYLIVRQTYSKIDVRLFSAESSSVSLSGDFFSESEYLHTLACTYRNTPTVLRRKRSPIGHGGLLLYVRGTPIHQLDGEYWTDRETAGEAIFAARSDKHAHDFGQAQGFKYEALKS